MIKSFFISFAAFVSLIAGAQDSITLSGKVVDAETNEPLTYASVTLKGKPVGTITNADGEFEFYVPENYMRDTLVISYVGYHYYCERVLSIKDHKKVVIKLKFKPMVLNEVVVVATKVAPQEIVKKAFEKVENNYPVNAHRLKGFYREIHEENEKTVLLVEAALDIYDQGYRRNGNKSTENEKVHLLDGRASKSYRNSAFNNTTREKWNLVVSALRHNPVKYPDPNVRKKGNTFMLDSIVYYNDRLIYVISFFTYISRFPNFERKNILYIDSENYAIYKYGWEEYAKKGDYSEMPWPLSKDSFYFSKRRRISTLYEFGEYNGRMYLKYFDEKAYDDIYNSKTDKIEFESLGHITLVVTEMEAGDVKPVTGETMRLDQSIAMQVKEYNSSFWSNENLVKLVPLTRKQVRDLEWELPLEDQFKRQSIKK